MSVVKEAIWETKCVLRFLKEGFGPVVLTTLLLTIPILGLWYGLTVLIGWLR